MFFSQLISGLKLASPPPDFVGQIRGRRALAPPS